MTFVLTMFVLPAAIILLAFFLVYYERGKSG